MREGDPLAGAVLRYRIMAYIVGTGLIILVFVGIPLQLVGVNIVERIVGTLHGFLYIVYLLTALDLVRRARLSFWKLLAMVAAGLVPFVAFIVERRVSADLAGEVR